MTHCISTNQVLECSLFQSQAGASSGSIPLSTEATTENLHFLLFIVCRPIIGRDYFEEFHIHFISSFILSVLSAYTKSSPSYMSEPPLKKKGGEHFKKNKIKKNITIYYYEEIAPRTKLLLLK